MGELTFTNAEDPNNKDESDHIIIESNHIEIPKELTLSAVSEEPLQPSKKRGRRPKVPKVVAAQSPEEPPVPPTPSKLREPLLLDEFEHSQAIFIIKIV